VQQLFRRGKYQNTVKESLKLKGRERDNRGKPVGRSGDEKLYAEMNKDPFRNVKRRKTSRVHPTSGTSSKCYQSLPFEKLAFPSSHPLSNNRRRSSSPKSTTVIKQPKQIQIQCQHEGCTKGQSKMYYLFCSDHKAKKIMCSECGMSKARQKGGLCRPCFKKRFPNDNDKDLRKARMCVECNIQVSRQNGGRCKDCISMFGKKRTKKHKAEADAIGVDAVDGTEVACVLSSEVVLQGRI
jgi:hypothetical protein